MRLIDADAFAEFLKDVVKRQKYEDIKIDGLLTVADVIEAVISELDGTSLDGFKNAPTIEPRNKGKWIYGESEAGNDGYYCSKCGNFVPWKYDEYDIDFIKEFLFCNKCGADMTEGEE